MDDLRLHGLLGAGKPIPKTLPATFLDGLIHFPIMPRAGVAYNGTGQRNTYQRDLIAKDGICVGVSDYTDSLSTLSIKDLNVDTRGADNAINVYSFSGVNGHALIVNNGLACIFYRNSGGSPYVATYDIATKNLISNVADSIGMYSDNMRMESFKGKMYRTTGVMIYELTRNADGTFSQTQRLDLSSKVSGSWYSLSLYKSANYLYALMVSTNGSTRPAKLVKYDLIGGVLTEISTVTLPTGLSTSTSYTETNKSWTYISEDDYLYMWGDIVTANTFKWYKISISTGVIVANYDLSTRTVTNLGKDYLLAVYGGFFDTVYFKVIKKADMTISSSSGLSKFTIFFPTSAGSDYTGFWTWGGVEGKAVYGGNYCVYGIVLGNTNNVI